MVRLIVLSDSEDRGYLEQSRIRLASVRLGRSGPPQTAGTPTTTSTFSSKSGTTTGAVRGWAVRLSAEQDNLLARWAWAIDTGNVDTAFSLLAGFAPIELSFRWPLLLDSEAALELPSAAAHPGYPLALAVSARFASNRADVTALGYQGAPWVAALPRSHFS